MAESPWQVDLHLASMTLDFRCVCTANFGGGFFTAADPQEFECPRCGATFRYEGGGFRWFDASAVGFAQRLLEIR